MSARVINLPEVSVHDFLLLISKYYISFSKFLFKIFVFNEWEIQETIICLTPDFLIRLLIIFLFSILAITIHLEIQFKNK